MLDPGQKLAYSVPEAVEASPWGKTTLYEMMASGELPWRMRFGKRYIMAGDLVAADAQWKAKRREAGAKPAPEPAPAPRCGVYLLLLDDVVSYIGRSTNLRSRLSEHRRSGRRFGEARVIACDAETAIWLEKELIRTLAPAQNVLRYQRQAKAARAAMRKAGLL